MIAVVRKPSSIKMKSVLAALVVTFYSTVVVAQGGSLADLPRCAQGCVGTSISVPGCQGIDIRCICSNREWLQGVACCLQANCSAEEQANAVTFAGSLCSTAGVTVPNQVTCPSAAGGASSSATQTTSEVSAASSSSATTEEATSTTTTEAETTTTETTPTSTPITETATSSPAATTGGVVGGYTPNNVTGGTNTTGATSPSGATPSGPSTPIPTGAAAAIKVGAGLSLAGIAAFMAALL